MLTIFYTTEDALIDNSQVVSQVFLQRRFLPIEVLQDSLGANDGRL